MYGHKIYKQKIVERVDATGRICPRGNHRVSHQSLPPLPKGSVWRYEDSEWKIVEGQSESLAERVEPEIIVTSDAAEEMIMSAAVGVPRTVSKGSDNQQNPSSETVQTSSSASVSPQYHRHKVAASDTFQGICLRYKVKPNELRRANKFSGTNLLLAPSVLTIPVDPASIANRPCVQDLEDSPETKIRAVLRAISNGWYGDTNISPCEAKCYLELNDWNVQRAIRNAQDDLKFEAQERMGVVEQQPQPPSEDNDLETPLLLQTEMTTC